jgi:hypothetical protein
MISDDDRDRWRSVTHRDYESGRFILNEQREPVVVDLMTWARWLEKFGNCLVAQTKIGDLLLSTVFLGIDRSFGRGPQRELFETAILFSHDSDVIERYSNWDDAAASHEEYALVLLARDEIAAYDAATIIDDLRRVRHARGGTVDR